MRGSSNNQNKNQVDVEKYRKLVHSYLDLHLYSTALFWADKVVTLSENDPRDIYWLAQCMFHLRQYHRAALLIRSKGLDKTHHICRYLAAKCLLEAKEFQEALMVLTGEESEGPNVTLSNLLYPQEQIDPKLDSFSGINLHSAILFLKGRIYEALHNRSLATECYKKAVYSDLHCFEAFNALIQHQMLTSKEEHDLLSVLFSQGDMMKLQCGSEGGEEFLKNIYENLVNKYNRVDSQVVIPKVLEGNLDMEVAKAERLYYACAYSECFSITEDVLKKDPYHSTCLPVHIACLVELNKVNALFYLAHDLVDHYPETAVSWFAVGCYYYITGKSDPARRFLGKATTLDRLFGPGWLAYGHSFAVENEHDQAMSAYFKASQLMKGCHLPLLYIGLECGLTNNIKLAEKFFLQAQSIAPDDPFVIHEMGVVTFKNNDFIGAEKLFETALQRVRDIDEPIIANKWEPLFNNLGHTCRKLKKYDKALEYHQQALLLQPHDDSTLASIGFVQALMGKTIEAINSFHKALGIRRDDTFSSSMLNYLMEQHLQESPPYLGAEKDTVAETSRIPRPEHVVPNLIVSSSQMSLESDANESYQDENNS